MFVIRLLMLLIGSSQVLAITNIEERRTAADQEGFYGRAELGLDAQSGNNEKRKWSVGLNGNWQGEQHRVHVWGNRMSESSNGRRTDDDTFFHTRLVLNYRKTWAEEGFFQYERDPFAALSFRRLAGGGMRYQTTVGEHLRWFQGTGLFHEWVLEQEPDGLQQKKLTRVNLYSHLQWQLPQVKLQTTLYFQPAVDDPADQRSLWQFSVSLPLGTHADLRWQWESRWDTQPPEGTEFQSHQTRVRLGINF